MRLWSLHPRYLDAKGLLAAWREGLLAQKVLEGLTKGYTHHPQLHRFREASAPLPAISRYLSALADEADARSYRFDRSKIHSPPSRKKISVTRGQIAYETALLRSKLAVRDPAWLETAAWTAILVSSVISAPDQIELNAVCRLVDGDVESWERIRPDISFEK